MSLKVTITEGKGGRSVVALEGRLDISTAPACEAQIAPLLQRRTKHLIFNLAKMDYLSTIGLRLLLTARKTLRSTGGRVLITHVQPQVARVLDVAEILPRTEIFDSVESADMYLDALQRKELVDKTDVDD